MVKRLTSAWGLKNLSFFQGGGSSVKTNILLIQNSIPSVDLNSSTGVNPAFGKIYQPFQFIATPKKKQINFK